MDGAFTQGSASFVGTTLGFVMESRWDIGPFAAEESREITIPTAPKQTWFRHHGFPTTTPAIGRWSEARASGRTSSSPFASKPRSRT